MSMGGTRRWCRLATSAGTDQRADVEPPATDEREEADLDDDEQRHLHDDVADAEKTLRPDTHAAARTRHWPIRTHRVLLYGWSSFNYIHLKVANEKRQNTIVAFHHCNTQPIPG